MEKNQEALLKKFLQKNMDDLHFCKKLRLLGEQTDWKNQFITKKKTLVNKKWNGVWLNLSNSYKMIQKWMNFFHNLLKKKDRGKRKRETGYEKNQLG